MPAAGCEEDGWANQRPAGVQEQDAQLQVSQADVGHLSVSFKDFEKDSGSYSYEMSWFPEHQPLEKEFNSSSSSHHWPWLV